MACSTLVFLEPVAASERAGDEACTAETAADERVLSVLGAGNGNGTGQVLRWVESPTVQRDCSSTASQLPCASVRELRAAAAVQPGDRPASGAGHLPGRGKINVTTPKARPWPIAADPGKVIYSGTANSSIISSYSMLEMV